MLMSENNDDRSDGRSLALSPALEALWRRTVRGDFGAAGHVANVLDEHAGTADPDVFRGDSILDSVRRELRATDAHELIRRIAVYVQQNPTAEVVSTLLYGLGKTFRNEDAIHALTRTLAESVDDLDEEAQYQLVIALRNVTLFEDDYLAPEIDLALRSFPFDNGLAHLCEVGSPRVTRQAEKLRAKWRAASR